MKDESFSISVSYPLDEGGLRYLLRIDQTGRAALTIESNVEEPEAEAIGIYQADIGREKALELKNMFSTLSKRPMPDSEPGLPTIPMVHVTLEEGGKTESRTIEPSSSSPAMCKVADHLKEVGKEVHKHPLRVIKLKAGLEKALVVRSEPIKLTIRLMSEGSEPVKIIDPLKAVKTSAGGFTVWGVRSDLPPADLWPQHSKHQAITPEYLVKADVPKEADAVGVLVLKPAQTVSYEFNIPIDWEPGEYAVKIIFETISSSANVLKGNIISMPSKLKVQ